MDDPSALDGLLRRAMAGIARVAEKPPLLEILPPASPEQVEEVANRIPRPLPPELRELFLRFSAGIRAMWSLDHSKVRVPAPLEEVDFGGLDLSLAGLPIDWTNWTGWEPCFKNPELFSGKSSYEPGDWDILYPLVSVINGDEIVMVTGGDHAGAVLYLDHEGGDFDGARLGRTFEEFLGTWFALGCPGPEYWCLEPFYDYGEQRLSLRGKAARRWLRLIEG